MEARGVQLLRRRSGAANIYAARKRCKIVEAPAHEAHAAKAEIETSKPEAKSEAGEHGKLYIFENQEGEGMRPSVAEGLQRVPGVKIVAFEVKPDPVNEYPRDEENEKPHFLVKHPNPKANAITIQAEDVSPERPFVPSTARISRRTS